MTLTLLLFLFCLHEVSLPLHSSVVTASPSFCLFFCRKMVGRTLNLALDWVLGQIVIVDSLTSLARIRLHAIFVFQDGHRVRWGDHRVISSCMTWLRDIVACWCISWNDMKVIGGQQGARDWLLLFHLTAPITLCYICFMDNCEEELTKYFEIVAECWILVEWFKTEIWHIVQKQYFPFGFLKITWNGELLFIEHVPLENVLAVFERKLVCFACC